jgi:uncharacterized protein YggE
MVMNAKHGLWLTLLVMLACIAQAQNPPTVAAQANSIYVSADGKFESAPDTALIQFNISAQENTVKAAYGRASDEAEQVRQILRANGVDPKLAEIGFFALSPMYDYRQPKHPVIGYRVTTAVSLKLKDFAKVGPIVAQLGEQEFAENVTLNYTLENMDAAKLRAVDDAFQRARAEAAALARASGRALGELVYASVDTYEQVRVLSAPLMSRAMMGAARAEAAPPTGEFTPQKVSVSAKVSTMFAMK